MLVTFLIAVWKGDWYLRLLAAGVLFFMLGYLAVDSQLRYMVTVMPLVIAVSVVGVDRFIGASVFVINSCTRLQLKRVQKSGDELLGRS